MGKKKFYFGGVKKSGISAITVAVMLLVSCFIGITLAFFTDNDFADKGVTMSGKVLIEAVGKATAYESIEDTENNGVVSTKLKINILDNYDYLIPGTPLEIPVNCKVLKSTTKPLLRASMVLNLVDAETSVPQVDTEGVIGDINSQVSSIVQANEWHLHTDGWYYFVGNEPQDPEALSGDMLLQEIETEGVVEGTYVPFITSNITFPTYVERDYSGLGVVMQITFQAIQNYIPDSNGNKMDNTITNSLKIFKAFDDENASSTSLDYFDVSIIDGKNTINLKSGIDKPSTVILPDKDSSDNPITQIGTSFSGNTGISKLVVPESYTSIQEGSFYNSDIQTIDLSKSKIVVIPDNCFQNSMIVSVKMPETLTTISEYSFEGSSLAFITIPESLTTIETGAFWDTSIKVLEIPKNVNSIAIKSINSVCLEKIVVANDNANYQDIDDYTLLTKNGTTLLKLVNDYKSETYMIPDTVTTLQEFSLYYSKNIKDLIITKSVQTINSNVFPTSLESVDVVNNSNFRDSDNLVLYNSAMSIMYLYLDTEATILNIPGTVTTIKGGAFVKGSALKPEYALESLLIGPNLSDVSENPFVNLSLKNIVVDESNTKLRSDNNVALIETTTNRFNTYARRSSLNSYTVPNDITKIADRAFQCSNNLLSINLPNGLTSIESGAFQYCNYLTNINIPNTVTSIGDNALGNLPEITSITVYGDLSSSLLVNCVDLKYLTIGRNVTSIDFALAEGCSSLEWISFESTSPPTFMSSNMFTGASSDFVIYVPDASVSAYKIAANFTDYSDKIKAISTRS